MIFKYSVISYLEENKELFILFCNRIISSAVIIQTKDDICYISYADSTGFFRNTTNFIISILQQKNVKFFVVFSYPKEELIFGQSNKNPKKNIMNSSELKEYWEFVISSAVGSNNICSFGRTSKKESLKRITTEIYSEMKDIPFFDDDPKSKMYRNFDSVKDFFKGLLVRTDFETGNLIFGIKNEFVQNRLFLMAELIEKRVIFSNQFDKILEFLRNSDFSKIEASKTFLELFLNKELLEIEGVIEKWKNKNVKINKIIPRRK